MKTKFKEIFFLTGPKYYCSHAARLFLLLLFTSLGSFAYGNSCSYLFDSTEIPKTVIPPHLKPLTEDMRTSGSSKEKTAHHTTNIPGIHGGELLVIKRIGETWTSDYTSKNSNDNQGDPTNIINFLSPRAAQFFGFHKLNDTEVTIPDTVEYNAATAKINRKLLQLGYDPIPVTFYPTSNKPLSGSLYNRNFGVAHQLPSASSGDLAIHDNLHKVSGIATPPRLANRIINRALHYFEFADYLRSIGKTSEATLLHNKIATYTDGAQGGAAGYLLMLRLESLFPDLRNLFIEYLFKSLKFQNDIAIEDYQNYVSQGQSSLDTSPIYDHSTFEMLGLHRGLDASRPLTVSEIHVLLIEESKQHLQRIERITRELLAE